MENNKYQKLSAANIIKNRTINAKKIAELNDHIDRLNQFAEKNPDYIDYLKERYPANNPRLAELNYKMDNMLLASDEYIETQFPENQRLFNKLQQSIKKNIKLTDPKTYKNVKDVPIYTKLLSVEDANGQELKAKKQIKLQKRNQKTAVRFIKNKNAFTSKIDEKIIQLDIELKRAGIIL